MKIRLADAKVIFKNSSQMKPDKTLYQSQIEIHFRQDEHEWFAFLNNSNSSAIQTIAT